MHKLICSIVFLGTLDCAMAQPDTVVVKEISPQTLSTLLAAPHVHVIDVNEDFTFAEAHVPGAKRLDYDAITKDVLPTDLSSAVIFYCWSPECPAAGMAAETAVKLGYKDVYWMHAGITGWQDAGLPTEP